MSTSLGTKCGRLMVTAGCRLLRVGRGGAVSILYYHRVFESFDPLWSRSITGVEFRRQMSILRELFRPVSISEAMYQIRTDRIVPGTVCVTFDDGYRDNHDVALRILRELEIPAMFFSTTGFMSEGAMWNDRVIEAIRTAKAGELDLVDLGVGSHSLETWEDRRAAVRSIVPVLKHRPPAEREDAVDEIVRRAGMKTLPRLMMSEVELRGLEAAGMEVGGHTRTHPILSMLDERSARDEIGGAKEELESVLGHRVRFFAYPNGIRGRDYTGRDVDLVRAAGFESAFTTHGGAVGRDVRMHEIPRFLPWETRPYRLAVRLTANQMLGSVPQETY